MFEYEMLSEIGSRKCNEDSIGMAQQNENICFVLADGLGGHGGGAEASGLVVNYIIEDFKQNGEVTEEYLTKCFQNSQDSLLQEQERQDRSNEMKTTLVVFLANKYQVLWGHIGDSRLYHFNNKKYQKRTLDHSVPQMLVTAGEIKEKEIRGHADRNRLLRVMGIEWDSPKYELVQPIEREKHMEILLCTDGFWELIEEKKMIQTLRKAKNPKEWLNDMKEEVIKNGYEKDMDNYSAIALFLEK